MPEEQASPCYSRSVGWVDLRQAVTKCLQLQYTFKSLASFCGMGWSSVYNGDITPLRNCTVLHCFTLFYIILLVQSGCSFDLLQIPLAYIQYLLAARRQKTDSLALGAGCWARSCTLRILQDPHAWLRLDWQSNSSNSWSWTCSKVVQPRIL